MSVLLVVVASAAMGSANIQNAAVILNVKMYEYIQFYLYFLFCIPRAMYATLCQECVLSVIRMPTALQTLDVMAHALTACADILSAVPMMIAQT